MTERRKISDRLRVNQCYHGRYSDLSTDKKPSCR